MFRRLLIANRGEIAVRISRTCRDLGIETVAVYSEADRRALHVLEADQALYIGPSPAPQSYLNIEAIIKAAGDSGADALHPGYGLLSENPALAEACAEAGIAFVGPPASAIRAMGDKSEARRLAGSAGVPTVPGYEGDSQNSTQLLEHAEQIGFPVMVKAALGGGGRGMRLVGAAHEFEEAVESARREAERAFGDGRLLLERAIIGARHVEVQVLGDNHGNVLHLGERDCSVQRRHQKVIEESPSPAVDADLRRRMGEAAVALSRAVGYVSAGTVEFLLAADASFYFLEMNTRLQVEHPVTEMITGLDLVALQIAIAAGEPLPFTQDDITFNGHAIECRIYAEDPLKGYLPSPGRVAVFQPPTGEGIRNDNGTYTGDEISTFYDPMLAKMLAWGSDRLEAVRRAQNALAAYRVEGVRTNLPLLRGVISHPVFRAGRATTDFLELQVTPEALVAILPDSALVAAFGALMVGSGASVDPWRSAGPRRSGGMARVDLQCEGVVHVVEGRRVPGCVDDWVVTLRGHEQTARFSRAGEGQIVTESEGRSESMGFTRTPGGVEISAAGQTYRFMWSFAEGHVGGAATKREHGLLSPMPGLVLKVLVRAGDSVVAHQTLVVIEAMKMEHAIQAPYDGTVKKVHCAEGGRVAEGVVLVELEQAKSK